MYFIAGSANEDTVAYVEKTNTATHNISKDRYVIWKDALYKAKSAISSGDVLSTTNLSAVLNGGVNAVLERLITLESTVSTLSTNLSNLQTAFTGFRFTQIGSNANLNNYMNAGLYGCANSTTAKTITNAPTTSSGFTLFVTNKSSYGASAQQLAMAGSHVYVRNYTSDGWSTWVDIST